jgi:hypothetical protein
MLLLGQETGQLADHTKSKNEVISGHSSGIVACTTPLQISDHKFVDIAVQHRFDAA